MQCTTEREGAYLYKLAITLEATQVDKAFDAATRKIARKVVMPGFRVGKVPISLVTKRHAQDIEAEALDQLVNEALPQAILEAGIVPISRPRVAPGRPSRGREYNFVAEVECQPEIVLQKTSGLVVKNDAVVISDGDVAAELERLRKEKADTVPVTDRDTCQQGDFVLADYTGTIDGKTFANGQAKNAMIEVGGAETLNDLAQGLIGAKVPSVVDIPVSFPADYGNAELAGRRANLHMTLKELKAPSLPPIDDELAIDWGEASLVALRQKTHDQLKAQADQKNAAQRRKTVLEALVEANPFDVPPSLVDAQAESIVSQALGRMERMTGQQVRLDQSQIDSLLGNCRKDADFQVRVGLLSDRIAKHEGVIVKDDEIQAAIQEIIDGAGTQAQATEAMYNDPDRREELRFRLLEDKVVRFLLDKSVAA